MPPHRQRLRLRRRAKPVQRRVSSSWEAIAVRQGRGSHQRATIDHRTRAFCEQTSSSRSRGARVSPTSEGQIGDFFDVMQAFFREAQRTRRVNGDDGERGGDGEDRSAVCCRYVLHNWVVEPLVEESDAVILEEQVEEEQSFSLTKTCSSKNS